MSWDRKKHRAYVSYVPYVPYVPYVGVWSNAGKFLQRGRWEYGVHILFPGNGTELLPRRLVPFWCRAGVVWLSSRPRCLLPVVTYQEVLPLAQPCSMLLLPPVVIRSATSGFGLFCMPDCKFAKMIVVVAAKRRELLSPRSLFAA